MCENPVVMLPIAVLAGVLAWLAIKAFFRNPSWEGAYEAGDGVSEFVQALAPIGGCIAVVVGSI